MGVLSLLEADEPGQTRTIFDREHALALVLILVSAGFLLIVLPFAGAILWAMIASISFHPMFRRLVQWQGLRPSGAALLTLAAIFGILALVDEASGLAERLRSGQIHIYAAIQRFQAGQPRWLVRALGLEAVTDLRQAELWIADGVAGALRWFAAQALNLGQRAFALLVGLGVTLYLSFFFCGTGCALRRRSSPPFRCRRTSGGHCWSASCQLCMQR